MFIYLLLSSCHTVAPTRLYRTTQNKIEEAWKRQRVITPPTPYIYIKRLAIFYMFKSASKHNKNVKKVFIMLGVLQRLPRRRRYYRYIDNRRPVHISRRLEMDIYIYIQQLLWIVLLEIAYISFETLMVTVGLIWSITPWNRRRYALMWNVSLRIYRYTIVSSKRYDI